jgi:hypothetical protein
VRRYEVEITGDAVQHLQALDRKYHGFIMRTLRRRLSTEPFTATRNRKPLTLPAPFDAHWELRFGPDNRFRAFYKPADVAVLVVAIGVKRRDRLFIGGQEF